MSHENLITILRVGPYFRRNCFNTEFTYQNRLKCCGKEFHMTSIKKHTLLAPTDYYFNEYLNEQFMTNLAVFNKIIENIYSGIRQRAHFSWSPER